LKPILSFARMGDLVKRVSKAFLDLMGGQVHRAGQVHLALMAKMEQQDLLEEMDPKDFLVSLVFLVARESEVSRVHKAWLESKETREKLEHLA